jgi:hypothetical protein
MTRMILTMLWSSFLVAIVAEGCFFSLFDPGELTVRGIQAELPPIAIYTVGFFFFWVAGAAASALTLYLRGSPDTANKI